jgi:hypothetical protein
MSWHHKARVVIQKCSGSIRQINSDREKLLYVIDNRLEVYKTFLDVSLSFRNDKLECLSLKSTMCYKNTLSYFVRASVTEKLFYVIDKTDKLIKLFWVSHCCSDIIS